MITFSILIVDDDPDDLDLLRSSFLEIGVKDVFTVESNREAIHFLQNAESEQVLPKLIITDLNMPAEGGHELLKFLKSTACFKHIPVIIFSTSASEKEIKKSLQLGALDYIPKPILIKDYIELATRIKEMIAEGH